MHDVQWQRVIPLAVVYAIVGAIAGVGFAALGQLTDSPELSLIIRFAAAILLTPVIYLILTSLILASGLPLGFQPQKQRHRAVHALLYGCILIAAIFVSILV